MKSKKYFVECKIGDRENGSPIMRTWYVTNLLKFVNFLDLKYSEWRWFNVKDHKTKAKLDSFTKYRRPLNRHI